MKSILIATILLLSIASVTTSVYSQGVNCFDNTIERGNFDSDDEVMIDGIIYDDGDTVTINGITYTIIIDSGVINGTNNIVGSGYGDYIYDNGDDTVYEGNDMRLLIIYQIMII